MHKSRSFLSGEVGKQSLKGEGGGVTRFTELAALQ